MAISVNDLAQRLQSIKDEYSNNPNINPAVARREMSEKEAQAIADFVIGRETTVTGTSQSGGTVTGTGVIKE
ncbi:hypothetical protein ABMY20_12630 [Tenacibaculum sp. SSH1-16]|uniref:hypothetical protein n=1 Tax=Tenacibaculum sp. SSH1-16 TaxID=3136667 RepID=UPI0032C456D1